MKLGRRGWNENGETLLYSRSQNNSQMAMNN
ncbi:WW domain-containing protein [Caenorhabditis elegans]|uniref:WW domain-containing protein n=1 Tax=Caenorhabditis elegans TaxID=6239 RepID=D6VPA8_CAEEL|nr:WW domain-containing protein [Caenorhabditis elegans]CBM41244.1 WW domain-containing protein [Caenorhabditis elegans]|eukprot:NP_001252141.1 Uncharacterized protein CELE_Y40B1A.1 [Caenorhabditis elegans]